MWTVEALETSLTEKRNSTHPYSYLSILITSIQLSSSIIYMIFIQLFIYPTIYLCIYRREALETSLTENEELHTSLSFLEEENQKLKDETEALRLANFSLSFSRNKFWLFSFTNYLALLQSGFNKVSSRLDIVESMTEVWFYFLNP